MSVLLLLSGSGGAVVPAPPVDVYRQAVTRAANSTRSDTAAHPYAHRQWTSRTRHYVAIAGSAPKVSFNNAYNAGVGRNDVTYGAAVEVGGAVVPFTFNGASKVTLTPGTAVTSDPLTGVTLTTGYVYVRTYTEIPTTSSWMPVSPNVFGHVERGEGTTKATGTDLTLPGSGAVPTVTGELSVPLALQVLVPEDTTVPAFASVSDSIGEGWGDSYAVDEAAINYSGANAGYFVRAMLPLNLPYINYSRGGDSASALKGARRNWWLEGITGCTHAVCGLATNDLLGNRTAGDIKWDNIEIWVMLKERGLTVVHHTCVPLTTSTDGFVTVGNQTKRASGATLTAWNEWLRDGAPIMSGTSNIAAAAAAVGSTDPAVMRAGQPGHPLAAVLDLAATVESSPGSGIWAVGAGKLTADGIHPTAEGMARMAVPLTEWAQTVTA